MKRLPWVRYAVISLAASAFALPWATAGEFHLKKGDRVAVVGDSITEQKQYSRFIEVVRNLEAGQAEVTWGAITKTFPKAELENGINFAVEFLDNPFSAPFQELDRAVGAKQNFETQMIKGIGSI